MGATLSITSQKLLVLSSLVCHRERQLMQEHVSIFFSSLTLILWQPLVEAHNDPPRTSFNIVR